METRPEKAPCRTGHGATFAHLQPRAGQTIPSLLTLHSSRFLHSNVEEAMLYFDHSVSAPSSSWPFEVRRRATSATSRGFVANPSCWTRSPLLSPLAAGSIPITLLSSRRVCYGIARSAVRGRWMLPGQGARVERRYDMRPY
jgi:hypothetical protein